MLCTLALAACPRPPGPVVSLAQVESVRLGWRFVPGAALDYRHTIVHTAGPTSSTRVEQWRYLVTSVEPDGSAVLHGSLTALGAGLAVDGAPVDDAVLREARRKERDAVKPVELALGLDGRLIRCTARDFGAGLAHRLLTLRMPSHAVRVHDEWPDPPLASAFAQLFPMEIPVQLRSTANLMELSQNRSSLIAHLGSEGQVDADTAMLVISGSATWDATAGVLASRTLDARYRGLGGAGTGVLRVSIERM